MYRSVFLVSILLVLSTTFLSFKYRLVDETHRIYVVISNIREERGLIQLQIYRDQSSFAKEKPYRNFFYEKKGKVKDGKMTILLENLPSGTYGLAMLDDENGNRKMDYSLMLPTEGFGFSDYYHTGWSRPLFDSFKFVLKGDYKTLMKIRYI